MRLSAADYAERTEALIEVVRLQLGAEQRRLEKIATMTVEEHLELIKTIIEGHLGANHIKIWYDVVGTDKSIITEEVARELRHQDWYVDDIEDGSGITISNFRLLDSNRPCEYDEYPYRKFTIKNERTTAVEFWVDFSATTSEKQLQRLMAFKDKIRVQLWDLVIPKERICKND